MDCMVAPNISIKVPPGLAADSVTTTKKPGSNLAALSVDDSGSSNSKLIGIIVGSTVGALVLIAIAICCCFVCMRPAAATPVNDFNSLGNYQMPAMQQRRWFTSFGDMAQPPAACQDMNYGAMPRPQVNQAIYMEPQSRGVPPTDPVYFNRPLFRNDFVKRFQPNATYGGRC